MTGSRFTPAELTQFGVMGAAYARVISKVEAPRVALLNMGNDAEQGGETLLTAHRQLSAMRGIGLRSASLSVTVANERAHRLYESLGFRLRKPFRAHAWVRPSKKLGR